MADVTHSSFTLHVIDDLPFCTLHLHPPPLWPSQLMHWRERKERKKGNNKKYNWNTAFITTATKNTSMSNKLQTSAQSGRCYNMTTSPCVSSHIFRGVIITIVKPVLDWANVCSSEHTSDTSTNYDSFLNWTFSSPNMVRTVQTLLHSQLACYEMQASARTCGRRAADGMIKNVG